MKKRILTLLICGIMSASLAACGKPSGMDQQTYDLGKNALTIMNDYLDSKITATDAEEKLDDIYYRLDSFECEDDSEEASRFRVQMSVSHFTAALSTLDNSSMLDARDSLDDAL